MTSFEQAFSDTERAAEAARKSAANVVSQAKALVKAARVGNVAGIKRGQEKLEEALSVLRQDVANAGSCWPFTEEKETRLFDEGYAAELQGVAAEKGLDIYERDKDLISYPSILRFLPTECAVRVDRKKVSTVRPSYLVDLLLKNQGKSSSFSSGQFLHALYDVYTDVVKDPSSGLAQGGSGRVVPLARIYKLMTALPGVARGYGRSDFARDLYILESKGPRCAKNGAAVSFPASTGTKWRSSDLFSFVGPDGHTVQYYGIRFSEDGG